jgi:hypothetical protein
VRLSTRAVVINAGGRPRSRVDYRSDFPCGGIAHDLALPAASHSLDRLHAPPARRCLGPGQWPSARCPSSLRWLRPTNLQVNRLARARPMPSFQLDALIDDADADRTRLPARGPPWHSAGPLLGAREGQQ